MANKWNRYKDVTAAGIVLLIATALFALSFTVQQNTVSTVGPGFMPRLVSILLVGLGLLNLRSSIRELRAGTPEKAADEPQRPGQEAAQEKHSGGLRGLLAANLDWVSAALILLYVFSIGRLGFVLASCGYMFLQMIVLSVGQKRNWLLFVILSAAVPAAIYLAFTKWFYLMLPAGILG